MKRSWFDGFAPYLVIPVMLALAVLIGMFLQRTPVVPSTFAGAITNITAPGRDVVAPVIAQAIQPLIHKAIPVVAPKVAKVVAAKLPVPAVAQHLAEPILTKQVEQALNDATTSQKIVQLIASVTSAPTSESAIGLTSDDSATSSVGLTLSKDVRSDPRRIIVGSNIQGGVVGTIDHATGYVLVYQWLKYGRTNDPRNLRFAFASPAAYFAPNVHELGVLPISVNVAELVPHQPFTNIWLSPYLSVAWREAILSRAGSVPVKRVGVAFTVTF